MNPTEEKTTDGDDQRFDLLVDGELSESQQRELLASLDDQPGGWRRCALAFLQAQAWRQDLGAIIRHPRDKASPARYSRVSWIGRHGGTLMAMAASFLVALVLGSLLSIPSDSPRGGSLPEMQVAEGTPTGSETVHQESGAPGERLKGSPATELRGSPRRYVQFASTDPQGGSRTIRLPAVEKDSLDADWLESQQPAIPAGVLEALERTGHQVRRHSELVPYRSPDGHQLVVPVDNYDVHYVGRPAL